MDVLPGKTIRYRAAFPWSFLGRETPPAPDESVWFAACVNDRDTPDGPLSQRHVFDFKDAAPKGFGRILLAPPANHEPPTTERLTP